MAAIPVSWFNSIVSRKIDKPAGENLTDHSRCPLSCILEKIRTSAPFPLTVSTSSTYIFLCAGSLARKSSSEMSSVPTAPRLAASETCVGPYQARCSSVPSILKNLKE
jgi:hypothetical protein